MADAEVPVDLCNPGQVFACLGLLEAADILFGEAEGGFDWSSGEQTRFRLQAAGDIDPVAGILHYLANSAIKSYCPVGYLSSQTRDMTGQRDQGDDDVEENSAADNSMTFPSSGGDKMTLPVRLTLDGKPSLELSHWADGSGRETFKLFAGNRSALGIARAMLHGTRKKSSKKRGEMADLKTLGLAQLWEQDQDVITRDPFNVLTPIGGSFNFDPRGTWTAIDAGYSPNDQNDTVEASPVVEILAALGLQHARPENVRRRAVRYACWRCQLVPSLARAALTGAIPFLPMRRFAFTLALSGRNKAVTFSQEELLT